MGYLSHEVATLNSSPPTQYLGSLGSSNTLLGTYVLISIFDLKEFRVTPLPRPTSWSSLELVAGAREFQGNSNFQGTAHSRRTLDWPLLVLHKPYSVMPHLFLSSFPLVRENNWKCAGSEGLDFPSLWSAVWKLVVRAIASHGMYESKSHFQSRE